jgi:flagellin
MGSWRVPRTGGKSLPGRSCLAACQEQSGGKSGNLSWHSVCLQVFHQVLLSSNWTAHLPIEFGQFAGINLLPLRRTAMSVINTNVSALFAQNSMKTNARAMSSAMEKLSTGSRINSAGDDAAGLAIGQTMTAQVRGLNMAVRNANDGINMMQTAEGAMVEQSNMLQRMRELAVQASNGTYSSTQRNYLQTEFDQLGSQITDISTDTTWNSLSLMDGAGSAGFSFQVGQNSGQTIAIEIGDMSFETLASGVTLGTSISTASAAQTTIAQLDTALESINSQRATIGAGINRLTYAADNLTNISANVSASRSSVMDTDYAEASTQLSKTQIIQQAATAMLAQANQQPQSVLSLLK